MGHNFDHSQVHEDWKKVQKVYLSCKTVAHIHTADKMKVAFWSKWYGKLDKYEMAAFVFSAIRDAETEMKAHRNEILSHTFSPKEK